MKKARSILWSFNYAIEGIVYTLRTQRNMRVHMVLAVLVGGGCLLLGIERMQLVAVVFAISLVFVTELVNTAIEATVDLSVERFDPLAKIAKDVAAGAVLCAAVNALIVAYLILYDPVRALMQRGLDIVHVLLGRSDRHRAGPHDACGAHPQGGFERGHVDAGRVAERSRGHRIRSRNDAWLHDRERRRARIGVLRRLPRGAKPC